MLNLFSRLRRGRWLGVIGGCLCVSAAYAGGEEVVLAPSPMTLFPYTPGVSLYGMGGNGWTATGDVLAPVVGLPQNFTYVDPQIYYHSGPDDFTASVGGGQRWLDNRAGILGAYVFGDYNHIQDGNSFWFVSPGIERLGEVVDLSVNGYIPVSNQRLNNNIVWADQLGNYNDVVFSGHTQYDELEQTFDSTGWGIDGQVGVRLPFRNTKLYFGGYYFSPKDNSTVGGGAVRAEVPINNYLSATVSEAYDSEFHNTVKGGLTVWLGGRETSYAFNGDLNTRMVDPIQRNLVATAGGAHTAQPVLSGAEDLRGGVEQTNISFFEPGSTPSADGASGAVSDGTYENPYQGMTQDNVNDGNAQNNRNFYIESGTYQAKYDTAVNPDFIVLNNDQLYGRTNNFRQTATGNARPLINFSEDGFEVPPGDTNDSFNDLRLSGSGSGTGIFINHDWIDGPIPDISVSMNDLNIAYFGDGVDILNGDSSGVNPGFGNATVSINNSVIENNTGVGGALISTGGEGVSGGIAAINGDDQLTLNVGGVTIANNVLDSTDPLDAAGGIAVVEGLPAISSASSGPVILNVNHTLITNNGTVPCSGSPCDQIVGAAGGIAILEGNDNNGPIILNVNNSQINHQTLVNSTAISAGGIAATTTGFNDQMIINVNNSQILNNQMTNGSNSLVAAGGIAATVLVGSINVNVTNSLIQGNQAQNNGGVAGGIAIFDIETSAATVNVIHSAIIGNQGEATLAAGGIATWTELAGPATVNVINSSIINNVGMIDGSSTTTAAGGIAMAGDTGSNVALNVVGSDILGNTGSGAKAAGGIATDTAGNFQGDQQMTIVNSLILGNIGNAVSGPEGEVAGGVAVLNEGVTNLTLTVKGSNISGNIGTGSNIVGGIALANVLDSNSTLQVKDSIISNNQGAGISAFNDGSGNFTATIDRSVVFGNTVGLNMDGPGTMMVKNPVFFNGVVNFSNGGVITFPGITPTNGQTVFCPFKAGTCSASAQ